MGMHVYMHVLHMHSHTFTCMCVSLRACACVCARECVQGPVKSKNMYVDAVNTRPHIRDIRLTQKLEVQKYFKKMCISKP